MKGKMAKKERQIETQNEREKTEKKGVAMRGRERNKEREIKRDRQTEREYLGICFCFDINDRYRGTYCARPFEFFESRAFALKYERKVELIICVIPNQVWIIIIVNNDEIKNEQIKCKLMKY